jgi:hypothetical protein
VPAGCLCLSRTVENEIGVGQHGDVTAVHVVGVGAHALGGESLQVGMDGLVVIGDDVPTRLRAPGGTGDLGVEQVRVWYRLGGPDQFLLLLGQVTRERPGALGLQPDAPVRDLDVVEDVGSGELGLLGSSTS